MSTKTSTDRICITGMGMVTSLGLDFVNGCAAARAGLIRLNNLNVLNFIGDELWGGEPVTAHMVPNIAEGFSGFAKVLLLGRHALNDLFARRKMSDVELNRTGIYINLSDQYFLDAHVAFENLERENLFRDFSYEERKRAEDDFHEDQALPSIRWKEECRNLIPRLLESCDLALKPPHQSIFFGNHVGIISAIQNGIKNIRLGKFDRCIVGGIDCCTEPRFLVSAAAAGVLKTTTNPIGFIPGEAAGFILLEKIEDAKARGIEAASLLGSLTTSIDKTNRLSDHPPNGIALALSIDTVLSALNYPTQEVGLVIGDLNGDSYRAMDWGHAMVRLESKYGIGDLPLWLPAMAFGETGAATGALSICTGTWALKRKYAPKGAILVWLSSDNGARAAACLQPVRD